MSSFKKYKLNWIWFVIVCIFLFTQSCTTSKYIPNSSDSGRMEVVKSAEALIGKKYKYGGKNEKGFDCSGLVHFVYQQQGHKITGSSEMQARLGKRIKLNQSKPGDLLFFSKKGKIFHVALIVDYTLDQVWVVHSTSSKGVIKENILGSKYWKPFMDMTRSILN